MEETATMEEQSVEMISFALIAAAGTARSLAFEALKAAGEHDFEKAEELIAQSKKAALEAHHQQTQLLVKEANGDHTPVNVMLVHAQDHLMTSMLAQELIEEMVKMHKQLAEVSA